MFERNNNLWLRDLNTGAERALTHDGAEHYVYGAPSFGWGSGYLDQVQARWSRDGTRVFVVQRDVRKVKELPIVHHVPNDGTVQPKLVKVKQPMQGDEHVMTLRLVAIDVDTGITTPAAISRPLVTPKRRSEVATRGKATAFPAGTRRGSGTYLLEGTPIVRSSALGARW